MEINGSIELANLTADPTSPVEGQLYYNSTSKVLKVYNGSSWEQVGGASALPWFHDSSAYSVYDDFESYSLGAMSTNAKWDVTLVDSGSATSTITSTTYAGGSGQELQIYAMDDNYGNSNVTVESNNLPADQGGYWARASVHLANTQDQNINYRLIGYAVVNGVSYQAHYGYPTANLDGSVQTAVNDPSITRGVYQNFEILIVKNGSSLYDLYISGKKVASDLATITSLGVKCYSRGHNGEKSHTWVCLDDVRYI